MSPSTNKRKAITNAIQARLASLHASVPKLEKYSFAKQRNFEKSEFKLPPPRNGTELLPAHVGERVDVSGFCVSVDAMAHPVSETVPRHKAVIILRSDRAHDIRINLWVDPKVNNEMVELQSTLKSVHQHAGRRMAIMNVYVTEFKTSKGVRIYEGNVNEISKFDMKPIAAKHDLPDFVFESKVVTAAPMELPLGDIRSAIMQFTKVVIRNRGQSKNGAWSLIEFKAFVFNYHTAEFMKKPISVFLWLHPGRYDGLRGMTPKNFDTLEMLLSTDFINEPVYIGGLRKMKNARDPAPRIMIDSNYCLLTLDMHESGITCDSKLGQYLDRARDHLVHDNSVPSPPTHVPIKDQLARTSRSETSRLALADVVFTWKRGRGGFIFSTLVCGHVADDGRICNSSVLFGHACTRGHNWDDQNRFARLQFKVMVRDLAEANDEVAGVYATVLFHDEIRSILGYSVQPDDMMEMKIDDQIKLANAICENMVYRITYRINRKGYLAIKKIEPLSRLVASAEDDTTGPHADDVVDEAADEMFGSQDTVEHIDDVVPVTSS